MDNQIIHFWFLALVFTQCCAPPVSETFIVSGKSPISVRRGHAVTLPCQFSSSQSAENLQVRWYRGADQYDSPILLYKDKAIDYSSQKASYAGRVSFGLKEETSGGLKSGDVSLMLENVKVGDVGDYTCFVSSLDSYDTDTVSLSVTEAGGSIVLSSEMKDNKVNVSCESVGWHPKPVVRWSENNRDRTDAEVSFGRNSTGLYSVHSWLLVSSSSEVSCSVGLSNEVPKEAKLRLKNDSSLQQESGSSAGWVAFGILLVAGFAAFGAMYLLCFRKKGNDITDGCKLKRSPEENEPLLPEASWQSTILSEAARFYVNVQLIDRGNNLVIIKGSKLRDAKVNFPDGDRVTCLTAVRGTPGFSSGQHYWEVSLKTGTLNPKTSWWIGVTDKHEIPYNESLLPTSKNGFWFLSSCTNQEHTLQFSSELEAFINVQSKPATIGVHLDFDKGKLSFYNVEEKSLIGYFEAKFPGELFPIFNPGKGDESPMEVKQRHDQEESNNIASIEKSLDAEQGQSGKTEDSVAES